MLNITSDWDLVAGGDIESFSKNSRPQAMPDNNIMVYMIDSELFHTFLNDYPTYRSFLVTRSLARRTYLFKVISEAEQVIRIKKKEVEHKDVFYAQEKPEYFFASESDEDD